MTNIPVALWSSDPTVAAVSGLDPVLNTVTGDLYGIRPGMVTFYASTTAYGITKTDTLLYRVGYPLVQFMRLTPRVSPLGDTAWMFVPGDVMLGVGGMVAFANNVFAPPNDIVFADADLPNVAEATTFTEFANPAMFFPPTFSWATQCAFFPAICAGAGNISLVQGGVGLRVFRAPGTYSFHSTLGLTGRIIVVDES